MRLEKILHQNPWTYSIILGGVSIPITLLFQWLSMEFYIVAPVLFSGLIAGYLVTERPISSPRAGWRAGLIGGLALLWSGFRFVMLVPEYSFTFGTSVLAVFYTILAIGLYIAYFGLVGGIGGFVGGWLADRFDGPRSPSSAN